MRAVELAKRFEQLRTNAGLTKTAVARPRYTVSYVSQIEAGKRRPSSEALEFFAGRLGVTPGYLATGVPEGMQARLLYQAEDVRQALRGGDAAHAEQVARAVVEEAARYGLEPEYAVGQKELGRALAMQGRFNDAVEAFESALEGDLPDRDRGMAVAGLGAAYRAVGDLTYAAECIESYLAQRGKGPIDSSVMAELQSVLVSIYFERGDVLRAERAARRAIAAADADSSVEARAIALWNASRVLAEARRWEEALECAGRARMLLEEHEDKRRVARLHNAYAFICLEVEPPRLAEAAHHLGRAEQLLETMSAPGDLAYVRTERSRLALLEGRLEDAVAAAEQALEGVGDDELEVARCLFLKGRALAGLGRLNESRAALGRAAGLFGAHGARQQEAGCWREIGEAHLEAGDVRAAVDALRRGLRALDPRRTRA